MQKKNLNKNLILIILNKEKQLLNIEKKHAQIYIKNMEKNFENQQKKLSFIKKLFFLINDFFTKYLMKFIEYQNKQKLKHITDEEKNDKILKHKIYTHSKFKVHYYLIRKFKRKIIVKNNSCANVSNFEYDVFLQFQYANLLTMQHLKNEFKDEKKANKYYEKIVFELKNKNIKNLINDIYKKIDNECMELQNNINNIK